MAIVAHREVVGGLLVLTIGAVTRECRAIRGITSLIDDTLEVQVQIDELATTSRAKGREGSMLKQSFIPLITFA